MTVLEYATPIIEVHASAGDNYLGGEDFTHLLLDEVLKRWNLDKSALTDSDLAALYACVEAANAPAAPAAHELALSGARAGKHVL